MHTRKKWLKKNRRSYDYVKYYDPDNLFPRDSYWEPDLKGGKEYLRHMRKYGWTNHRNNKIDQIYQKFSPDLNPYETEIKCVRFHPYGNNERIPIFRTRNSVYIPKHSKQKKELPPRLANYNIHSIFINDFNNWGSRTNSG